MTIAEQILSAKWYYDEVYAAGYEKGKAEGGGGSQALGALYYAANIAYLYDQAVFPENTSLTLRLEKPPSSAANTLGAYRAFAQASGLKNLKIVMDDKDKPWYIRHMFNENKSIETVDFTECSRKFIGADHAFYNATALISVFGALDVSECTNLSFAFHATALMDIEFVPNTITTDIRFPSGYLSEASKESIINGLVDLTGSTTKTITLNGVGRNLTDDQKERISAKNWTLAY